MTAGGEADRVDKAKKVLINAAIGLAIILASFAIAQFVLNRLIAATTGGGRNMTGEELRIIRNSGSLGRGIVDMHYSYLLTDQDCARQVRYRLMEAAGLIHYT